MILIIFPLIIFLITSIINSFTGPYISNDYGDSELDLVSMLVPARNEEKNIKKVIESLQNQKYPNFEIIILDDNSSDKTYEIAKSYANNDDRIKVIKGTELPNNWLGKNWACKQLADVSKGKFLIFTDADNFHNENAIINTVAKMKKYNLNLLSAFPEQKTITFPEKLIIPVIDLIIYSGLILWTTYFVKLPAFAAANGQWIAFDRNSYFELNGHEAVKTEIVEDVALSRHFKKNGKRILTCSGKNMIFGRMYSSFSEIWNGLSKNVFGLTDFKSIPFFILLIVLFVSTVLPYLLLASGYFIELSLIVIALNMLWRLILAINYKHNILISLILHPISMLVFILIGINSFTKSKYGSVKWKDRVIKIEA